MNPELKEFIKQHFFRNKRVLDLGSGDNADILSLEKQGWFAQGVDIKTGTDLNDVYVSPHKPFDLVISNYVIQKLKTPKSLVETISQNLAKNGCFFVQTFHISDKYTHRGYSTKELKNLFDGAQWVGVNTRQFTVDDEEDGHNHRHEVLEITGKKI